MTRNGRIFSVLTLLAATSVAACAPSHAQDMTLNQVLTGRGVPLSIMAKQLNGEYRRMVVNGPVGIASVQNMMISAKSGVETGLYFSKGETVTAGEQTYLIAYRPQFDIDPMIFNGHGHGDDDDTPVQPRKLRPNMVLSLSLLNLRTNARLDDISVFDPKRDMESPQESSEASLRNLRALGRGMMTYLRSRGQGIMPQTGATLTPALKRTFYPFVHDQNLWIQPATEEPYRANANASGVNINRITNKQLVPAFYEGTPGSDGLRGVVFLDGHVERVSADRWSRLQRVKPATQAGARRTSVSRGGQNGLIGITSPDEDA